MLAALLIARIALAAVFLTAGATKLLDRPGFRRVLAAFGLERSLAHPVSVLIPVAEVAVAAGLLVASAARWAALGALLLLAVFGAAILGALARGRAPDCHCFGRLRSARIGWHTL